MTALWAYTGPHDAALDCRLSSVLRHRGHLGPEAGGGVATAPMVTLGVALGRTDHRLGGLAVDSSRSLAVAVAGRLEEGTTAATILAACRARPWCGSGARRRVDRGGSRGAAADGAPRPGRGAHRVLGSPRRPDRGRCRAEGRVGAAGLPAPTRCRGGRAVPHVQLRAGGALHVAGSARAARWASIGDRSVQRRGPAGAVVHPRGDRTVHRRDRRSRSCRSIQRRPRRRRPGAGGGTRCGIPVRRPGLLDRGVGGSRRASAAGRVAAGELLPALRRRPAERARVRPRGRRSSRHGAPSDRGARPRALTPPAPDGVAPRRTDRRPGHGRQLRAGPRGRHGVAVGPQRRGRRSALRRAEEPPDAARSLVSDAHRSQRACRAVPRHVAAGR